MVLYTSNAFSFLSDSSSSTFIYIYIRDCIHFTKLINMNSVHFQSLKFWFGLFCFSIDEEFANALFPAVFILYLPVRYDTVYRSLTVKKQH